MIKKKLFKIFIALCILMSCVFVFSSCKNNDTTPTASNSDVSPSPSAGGYPEEVTYPEGEKLKEIEKMSFSDEINSIPQKLSTRDYGYMWWEEGIRNRGRVNFLTGYYGLALNPANLNIDFCGPVANPVSASEAAKQDNSVIQAMPQHSIKLYAKQGDELYSSTTAPFGEDDKMCNYRIVEAGQYSQRFDIINFPMTTSTDKTLPVQGHLEIHALPEYFSLIYELMPEEELKSVEMSFSWTLPEQYTNFTWLENRAVCVTDSEGNGFVFIAPEFENGTPKIGVSGNTLLFSMEAVDFTAPSGKAIPKGQPHGHRQGFSIYVMPLMDAKVSDAYKVLDLVNLVEVKAEQGATNSSKIRENDVAFDPVMGDIKIELEKFRLDNSDPTSRNALDRMYLRIENSSDTEMKIPLVLWRMDNKSGSAALSVDTGAVVIIRELTAEGADSNGQPIGLPVQLSKNWHQAFGDLYEGYYLRFTTFITVPAKTAIDYEVTLAYSMWGGVNSVSHSQLSLVGWGFNTIWEQSALGSNGENICYEPEGMNCDGAMIDDVRPLMTHPSASGKWGWTGNVGGGNFLTYVTNGVKQYQKRVTVDYRRVGPNLSEVTYNYVTNDEAIAAKITSNLGRTDDLTRVYYTVRYDVLKDTTFSRLALFQLGADYYNTSKSNKLAYGNSEGEIQKDIYNLATTGNVYIPGVQNLEWTGENRWAIMYECDIADKNGVSDKAIVLREWKAKVNGNENAQPYLSSFATVGGNSPLGSTNWEITLGSVTSLKKGDYIEMVIEMDVIPQSVDYYYGPRSELLTRMMMGEEKSYKPALFIANENDVKVDMKKGTLNSRLPVDITVENDSAEFTITNGMGYLPITFRGLSTYKGFRLEEKVNGTWTAVDQATHGNDFWQCYYEPDTDTYNITYNVNRNADGAVTEFRLVKE